jgi:2-hydroxy-3-keto-5-methylthiopentenyl-1-phosphate phosphatase
VTITFTGEFHEIFNCLKCTQATSYSYQFTGKPLPTGSLKDDLKEFMELVPTDKILEITLDYLANDPEVREFVDYIHSEQFPKIHTVVEHLKEYTYVSALIRMFLKHQSNRENICSLSTGV